MAHQCYMTDTGEARPLTWQRLFVRSGIRFEDGPNGLLRLNESQSNLEFIRKVLDSVGLGRLLPWDQFYANHEVIEERTWFDAWNRIKCGAESGGIGFESIDFTVMDAYIVGVVRWLNGHGYKTYLSCDGYHRNGRCCWIELVDPLDEPAVANLIRGLRPDLQYGKGTLARIDVPIGQRDRRPGQDVLLDLAEQLHVRYVAKAAEASRIE